MLHSQVATNPNEHEITESGNQRDKPETYILIIVGTIPTQNCNANPLMTINNPL